MKRVTSFLVILAAFGCEDSSPNSNTSPPQRLDGRLSLNVDATQPQAADMDLDAHLVVQWDQAVDAAVDAAPVHVCERSGLREPCNIEGLLGPCATGEKICYLTYWTPCSPVVFPRREICDDIDNDCDGRLNEAPNALSEGHQPPQYQVLSRACYDGTPGSQKFGPCRPGISFCESLSRITDAGIEEYFGYGECQGQTLPSEESCDSIDNDCDESIDEGVINACGECGDVPPEICDGGHFDEDCDGLIDENLLNVCGACGPDPIEVCDFEDNDCDGEVDEELRNACDLCGDLPREMCDFIDNDCDGLVDEDFADQVCACDHPDYVPQPEVCNGADEDCDGFIDEGPGGGPLSMLCSTDLLTDEVITYARREDGPQYAAGDCRLGAAFCEQRRDPAGMMEHGYFDCQQEILPSVERCNDEDDDCDGQSDEDFAQGAVAVMMVVDVSGSMNEDELEAAFTATRDSVQRLFNGGVVDVCYMLAVVGNDDMPDPYLFYPADTCVPGVEDPPVVPIEDMANAVNTLMLNIQAGTLNQGGATENTLDAMGRFFTDDRIDWDRDGINDNVLWNTNRPQAQIQGIEDEWEVDLSLYTHRIVIVLGDENAQGVEYNNHAVASAMAHANGMAFIIGNRQNEHSYQPLIDFGAVHVEGLGGLQNQDQQRIIDTVVEAIEEAACINAQQEAEQASYSPETEIDYSLACYQPDESDVMSMYKTLSCSIGQPQGQAPALMESCL